MGDQFLLDSLIEIPSFHLPASSGNCYKF